jgi:hypothetical protein
MDRKKYRAVWISFTQSSDSSNKTQNVPDNCHSLCTIYFKTDPFCTNTMVPNTCPYLLAFQASMVHLFYCSHLYCLHLLKLTSFPTNCQISKQEEVCLRHNKIVGGQWNNRRCFCEKNSGLRVPRAQYCADGKETSHVATTILVISCALLLQNTIQESAKFLDSLLPSAMLTKHRQCTLSFNHILIVTQQHKMLLNANSLSWSQ